MSLGLCADEPVLKAKQQQLAAKEFSAGVIAFYWAVNTRLDALAHHNVFLSGGQGFVVWISCPVALLYVPSGNDFKQ